MSRPRNTVPVRLWPRSASGMADAIVNDILSHFPRPLTLTSRAGRTAEQIKELELRDELAANALRALVTALLPKNTGRKRAGPSIYFLPREGIRELRNHGLPSLTRLGGKTLMRTVQKLHRADSRRKGPRSTNGWALDRRIANGLGDERWLRRLRARRREKPISAIVPRQPKIDLFQWASFVFRKK